LARVGSPERGKWVVLPDQTRELGKRIIRDDLPAWLRRFRRAAIGIRGAIGS
jgi:hypothetical protein